MKRQNSVNKKEILNYLKEHYQEFHKKYHVQKIGLFGSYARDEENENSDIDIFVNMEPSMWDMITIKQQLEEKFHKKVDIIREHKNIKPFCLEMINKDLIYA